MLTYVLYALAIVGLAVSFYKSPKKTKMALKKAWKSFENILPQFAVVIVLIGMVLSIVDDDTISMLLGSSSGIFGVLVAAIFGSITLIPGFVAFPLAAALLENGAGVSQIAAFVSTLMMVGIVTFPMEASIFSKKVATVRNCSAFLFSLCVAFAMGVVL